MFFFSDVACVYDILSPHACEEDVDIVQFAHTALVLHTPDSNESVVNFSRTVGIRAKNDCGVALIQESSSSDAEIVPPARESASPV